MNHREEGESIVKKENHKNVTETIFGNNWEHMELQNILKRMWGLLECNKS